MTSPIYYFVYFLNNSLYAIKHNVLHNKLCQIQYRRVLITAVSKIVLNKLNQDQNKTFETNSTQEYMSAMGVSKL